MGYRIHFAAPYNYSYFPGLFNQALFAPGFPMQCPLQMYPGPPTADNSCPLDSSRSKLQSPFTFTFRKFYQL